MLPAGRPASLPPLSIPASHPSPLALTGFAFFGVATAIFGFMSYVRNVKPEARLIYYLVRARLLSAQAPAFFATPPHLVTSSRRPAAPPCR